VAIEAAGRGDWATAIPKENNEVQAMTIAGTVLICRLPVSLVHVRLRTPERGRAAGKLWSTIIWSRDLYDNQRERLFKILLGFVNAFLSRGDRQQRPARVTAIARILAIRFTAAQFENALLIRSGS
jgi:hypothetical protein